jgi:hypothetical protein
VDQVHFGDASYDRERLLNKAVFLDFNIEVFRRLAGQDGFTVLPRRWIIGCSFGWMVRWRCPVCDHKARPDVTEDDLRRHAQSPAPAAHSLAATALTLKRALRSRTTFVENATRHKDVPQRLSPATRDNLALSKNAV